MEEFISEESHEMFANENGQLLSGSLMDNALSRADSLQGAGKGYRPLPPASARATP
jgi:hypothetical protein